MGALGHRPVLPVGAGLRELVGPQVARSVGTVPPNTPKSLSSESAARTASSRHGACTHSPHSWPWRRWPCGLPGLGTEPPGRQALAGGLVHPAMPALAGHQRQPRSVGALPVGGVPLLRTQRPSTWRTRPSRTRASGRPPGVQPLAAVALDRLPELGDAQAGQARVTGPGGPQRVQPLPGGLGGGADLAGNLGRVQMLAVADLAGSPGLLDALQWTCYRLRRLRLVEAELCQRTLLCRARGVRTRRAYAWRGREGSGRARPPSSSPNGSARSRRPLPSTHATS